MWDPIGLKTLGDLTLQVYTNLTNFLNSDERSIAYRFRLRNNSFHKLLVKNKYYGEYADEIVRKIKQKHDQIYQTLMIVPLPQSVWDRMRSKIRKKAAVLRNKEALYFTVKYELDDAYELVIELTTTVH